MRTTREQPRWALRLERWLRQLMALLCVAAVFCALLLGAFAGFIHSLPPIEELENYNPKQTTTILDRTQRQAIGAFSEEQRELINPREDAPGYLSKAFVAIEDERFYQHFGIDPKAVARAVLVNLRRGHFAQGFSTLTLQLPRNILPERVSREKTLKRKLEESVLALQIERRYSKEQILEFYMNQVYLGAGSYGVQAAARNYFGKTVRELTLAEASLIAGLPQKPSVFNPWINPDEALKRRNQVLEKMRDVGYISPDEYKEALNEPLELKHPQPVSRTAPYFVEYLRGSLLNLPEFKREDLQQKGYTIDSTLDVGIQRIVDEELLAGLMAAEQNWQRQKTQRLREERQTYEHLGPGTTRLARITAVDAGRIDVMIDDYRASLERPEEPPYFDPDSVLRIDELLDVDVQSVDHASKMFAASLYDKTHIQGAVVVLDASNGDLLAISGGADFFDANNNGQWNRAVQSARQPGSCLKPFFYAAALENGYTPASVMPDEPITFGDNYTPQNYENRYFGPTALEEALEHSRNVPTIMLFREVGIDRSLDFVRKFDMLSEIHPWKLRPELPTCLGNTNVNLLELAAAYLPFANAGVGMAPRAALKIEDPAGVIVKEFKPVERRVINPETAFLMTTMLQGVMTRGTGSNIAEELSSLTGLPQMAGKTGTTNDCVDAWFMGYTPQLVIGVYVGFDRNRSMGPQMTGSRVAGPVWAGILRRLHLEQPQWTAKKEFSEPENIIRCNIDKTTGLLAGPGTPSRNILRNVAFIKGTEPKSAGY
ncbi:PBP1A family penicillin-binding protein [Candidatus Sumerlaeota bacterium]|nr:PBP1A family penicillin-binding protein [Candidatus Sumerlaeota bacterium]